MELSWQFLVVSVLTSLQWGFELEFGSLTEGSVPLAERLSSLLGVLSIVPSRFSAAVESLLDVRGALAWRWLTPNGSRGSQL